jgi:hypothetical protein
VLTACQPIRNLLRSRPVSRHVVAQKWCGAGPGEEGISPKEGEVLARPPPFPAPEKSFATKGESSCRRILVLTRPLRNGARHGHGEGLLQRRPRVRSVPLSLGDVRLSACESFGDLVTGPSSPHGPLPALCGKQILRPCGRPSPDADTAVPTGCGPALLGRRLYRGACRPPCHRSAVPAA